MLSVPALYVLVVPFLVRLIIRAMVLGDSVFVILYVLLLLLQNFSPVLLIALALAFAELLAVLRNGVPRAAPCVDFIAVRVTV